MFSSRTRAEGGGFRAFVQPPHLLPGLPSLARAGMFLSIDIGRTTGPLRLAQVAWAARFRLPSPKFDQSGGPQRGAVRRANRLLREEPMNTGTVKWFNDQKGYGFIQPDNGGKDVFVHVTAVERSGLRGLAEGQKISYELQTDQRSGKTSAVDLKAV
jgi:CspA family cold shock protein